MRPSMWLRLTQNALKRRCVGRRRGSPRAETTLTSNERFDRCDGPRCACRRPVAGVGSHLRHRVQLPDSVRRHGLAWRLRERALKGPVLLISFSRAGAWLTAAVLPHLQNQPRHHQDHSYACPRKNRGPETATHVTHRLSFSCGSLHLLLFSRY